MQSGNSSTVMPNVYHPQPIAGGMGNPYAQQAVQHSTGGGGSNSAFMAGMNHAAGSSIPTRPAYTGPTSGPVRYLPPTDSILPISQLTIYTQKWTIKARVTSKSELRTFRNARGEGQLMSLDLVDAAGGEIRGTFFGAAASKYHALLTIGKVFRFSKGSVKPANPKFNPKAQYELTFDEHSEIQEVADEGTIPSLKLDLVPIKQIGDFPLGDAVDILPESDENARDIMIIEMRSSGNCHSSRCDANILITNLAYPNFLHAV